MKIIKIVADSKNAKKYSHPEYKSKAWKQYGIGEDGFLYVRGNNSGYVFNDWVMATIHGLPISKKLLEKLCE